MVWVLSSDGSEDECFESAGTLRSTEQGEPLGGANIPPCVAGKKDGWGGI